MLSASFNMIYFCTISNRRAPTIPTECCHCLFLVCTLLANKFVKDEAYRNVHFAKWCGMPVKELGKLEMAVLECMDYRMSVNPKLFETFAHLLVVPRSAAPASARPAFTGQVHSGAALRCVPLCHAHTWTSTCLRLDRLYLMAILHAELRRSLVNASLNSGFIEPLKPQVTIAYHFLTHLCLGSHIFAEVHVPKLLWWPC